MGCKSKKPKVVSKSRPRITKVPVLLKAKPKRRKAKPDASIRRLPPEMDWGQWVGHNDTPKRKSLLARIANWFMP